MARRKTSNPYYSGPVSDHFDGHRFFNPGGSAPRGFRDALKWQFLAERAPWPSQVPSPLPQAVPEARLAPERLKVTMVGHATMLLQAGGLNMLTDPVWARRASPFSFAGPARRNAPGIAFEDLPPIDVVLLTHNHYDHCDLDTLAALKARHDPLVVTPLGNDTIVRSRVPEMRLAVLDWAEKAEVAEGIHVHAEPCHHWSARGTADRRMALWAAFAIATPHGSIYHVGDTGFHGGRNYREAARRHGPFRLAILPIGAYEPRWFMREQHQDPHEAVEGMMAAQAAFAVGHHWGTFRLTNEGVHEPVDTLHAALDARAIARERFRALRPGEAVEVPPLADAAGTGAAAETGADW